MFQRVLCSQGKGKRYGRLHRSRGKSNQSVASLDHLDGRNRATPDRIQRRLLQHPVRRESDAHSSQGLALCSRAIRWSCESCCRGRPVEHGAHHRKIYGWSATAMACAHWPAMNKRCGECCRLIAPRKSALAPEPRLLPGGETPLPLCEQASRCQKQL